MNIKELSSKYPRNSAVKAIIMNAESFSTNQQLNDLYQIVKEQLVGRPQSKDLSSILVPKIVYLSKDIVATGSEYKFYTMMKNLFGGINISGNKEHITKVLKELSPDLLFLKGDRSDHFRVAIELQIPYVLIANDVHSLRLGTEYSAQEEQMFAKAEFVIFNSPEVRKFCKDNYNVKNDVLIYARPLKADLSFAKKRKLRGKNLVYAGGLVGQKLKDSKVYYRYYKDIFSKFLEQGWNIHIYTNQDDTNVIHEYEEIGCVFHGFVPQGALYKELSQYTAGLQAYGERESDKEIIEYKDYCLPNKTWEYLAAGIPTIGYNTNKTCNNIYKNKWGVVLDSLDEINDIDLPDIDDDTRHKEVLESDSEKFREIFRYIFKKEPPKNGIY